MEIPRWFTEHLFNIAEAVGIIGGLFFNAYTIRRDEQSRRISNLIAINQEHRQIWKEFYPHPGLSRITARDPDLKSAPITPQEEVFVNSLIVHLDTVHRALHSGLYVKIEGLQKDILDFFSLPIPKAVWNKVKKYQDSNFVRFVEASFE